MKQTGSDAGRTGSPGLLLVEDNPADARLAMEAFAEAGVEMPIARVADGVEALAYLHDRLERDDLPRLMLLDLNLPRMDGREVLREVKGDARLRHLPVLVMTTSTAEADVVQCYDLQANAFIAKPVELEQFEKVARTIARFWLEVAQLP